jgi:hypothetical protein
MNLIITITDDEKDILDSWLGIDKIQSWLQHAIDNKIRQRVDASVLELTDRNPKKLSKEEKMTLLKTVKLPTREDRDKVK